MPRPATFGTWTELRPGNGRQPDPGFYAQRLEEAVLAEQLGLAAVWGSEHHAVEDGHLSQQFPFLAAVAARTSRVRLGTGVLLLPLYRPREVAEQAGVVDLLAASVIWASAAAGWSASSTPSGSTGYRGALLEEKLPRLRRAGRQGPRRRPRQDRPARRPALAAARRPAPLPRRHRPRGAGPGGQAGRRLVRPGPLPLAEDGRGLAGAGRGPGAGRPAGRRLPGGGQRPPAGERRPGRTWATELAPAIAYQLDRYGDWAPTATSRAPTRSTPAGSSGRRPSATPPRGSWPP